MSGCLAVGADFPSVFILFSNYMERLYALCRRNATSKAITGFDFFSGDVTLKEVFKRRDLLLTAYGRGLRAVFDLPLRGVADCGQNISLLGIPFLGPFVYFGW